MRATEVSGCLLQQYHSHLTMQIKLQMRHFAFCLLQLLLQLLFVSLKACNVPPLLGQLLLQAVGDVLPLPQVSKILL